MSSVVVVGVGAGVWAHGERAGQGRAGQHLDELVGGEHLVVEHRLRHGAHLAVEHVRARHLQQLPLLVRKRIRYTSIERNKQTLVSSLTLVESSHIRAERVPERERGSQEHFGALEQHAVPEAQHCRLRQTRREQRQQPLHAFIN